jgi:excisionase family DNA binding protein
VHGERDDAALTVVIPAAQFEALARRVAALIEDGRDEGFLDVVGAAKYLSTTPKAIYRLVERRTIPFGRAGGRLLFDRRELRAYAEGR